MITLYLLLAAAASDDFSGSFVMSYDGEPIYYADPPRHDPIAQLQRRIDSGETKLEFEAGGLGWLRSVLKALGISPTTQTLVFSKTSLQLYRIAPSTPRAIYFNDDVYIGYVQHGEVMEVSAADPERGGMFYTLDQKPAAKPKFARRDECLQCHASPKTLGVPGHVVRSVYSDPEGYPMTQIGSFVTDHRSPMNERYGGWFITGTTGGQPHMGNAFAYDRNKPDVLKPVKINEVADLSPYLTRHGDIVALTVMAHQTALHNYVTRVNYETRVALHMQAGMNKALGRPENELSESVDRRLTRAAHILARQVLFAGEPALKAPLRGTSGFEREFGANARRDKQGRSLRDFDLRKRLFKYPCSYLVYTPSFAALPKIVRDRFEMRLIEILTAKDASDDFAHLSAADRRAILEILNDTKPAWWHGYTLP